MTPSRDTTHAGPPGTWQNLTAREIQDLTHREIPPWVFHLILQVQEALERKNT